MKATSQPLSLKKLFKHVLYSIKLNLDCLMPKHFVRLVWRVGSRFFARPNSPAQVPSLTSQKCCYVDILAVLGTWDLVWSGKSQLPRYQRLRLQGLTWSDLGLRTWDPLCEPAPNNVTYLTQSNESEYNDRWQEEGCYLKKEMLDLMTHKICSFVALNIKIEHALDGTIYSILRHKSWL